VHPNDPILDPSERLTQFSHPSEELIKKSNPYLERLISTADIKKGNIPFLYNPNPYEENPLLKQPQSHQKQKAANANAKPRNLSQA
jgi:hypothetical protein